MDPSDDSNAISLESGTTFYAFYDMGFTNGISNHSAKKIDIKVYPNPAHDILNIKVSLEQTETYSLNDLSGRKVQQGILNAGKIHQIDITGLTPGFYLLSVQSNNGIGVQKIQVY